MLTFVSFFDMQRLFLTPAGHPLRVPVAALTAGAALLLTGCGGSGHSSTSASSPSSPAGSTATATRASTPASSSAPSRTGATTASSAQKVLTVPSPPSTAGSPTTTTPKPIPAPGQTPAPKPVVFTGTGKRDIGSFATKITSFLTWSCAGDCTPFEINNSLTDSTPINVYAASPGSGDVILTPGHYHKITITTAGRWKITLGSVS
jgi:hypothetical protein